MEQINQGLHALLNTHPLIVIALLILIEEFGIPSPIPGDLMMILAGVKVAQGLLPLWLVLVVQEAATLAGACGLYAICRRAGRPLVTRYGRYIRLGPKELARAEEQIQRRGLLAVVLGRLIPGLRIVTPIAAGTLEMPFRQFFPAVALGAFLYLLAYTMLGRILGPAALVLFERVVRAASAFVSVGVAIVVILLARRIRRAVSPASLQGHARTGAAFVAGLVAGVVALLTTNGLITLVRLGWQLTGRRAPDVAPVLRSGAEISTGLHLLIGWPGFVLLAGLLGLVAGRLIEGRPRHFGIALATLLPLVLTLLFIVPLVTHPGTRIARDSAVILLGVEVVRWVVFGIALADFLPLADEGEAGET